MEDLRALSDSILDQARQEAAGLILQATAQAETIRAEAARTAEQQRQKTNQRYQQRAAIIARRYQTAADLQGKQLLLKTKQELIAAVFQDALQTLEQLSEEQRVSFLTKRVTAAGQHGAGTISGAGSAAEWKKILAAANQAIKQSGATWQLTLAETKPDFKGGFILKGANFTINGSYQVMLDEIKETLMPEIAALLFQSGKE